jgi:hypothetical protein
MVPHRTRDYGVFLVSASTLLTSCSDRYDSCEATRTCASPQNDGGPGGTSGSPAGGSSGAAGEAPGGTAGSVVTGGTGGVGGAAATGGDAATGGSVSTDSGLDALQDAPPVDKVAPTIVSVSPADGATGVRKDVSISIVFSEPMDRDKTQAAYSSADLQATAVAFSWSPDDMVLTIDPRADLVYVADAIPLAAAAKKYAFGLATTATDRAGNGLSSAFTSSFSTSREVSQTLPAAYLWYLTGDSTAGIRADPCGQYQLYVGDLEIDGLFEAGVFQFDLSGLAPGIQAFTEATLRARQNAVIGTPFGTNQLGNITLEHTNFDPVVLNSILAAPLRMLGVFSNDATPGPRSLDVLVAVTEDHQNRVMRSYRSQYRLAFTRRSNGNQIQDAVEFRCAQGARPELAIKYLIP